MQARADEQARHREMKISPPESNFFSRLPPQSPAPATNSSQPQALTEIGSGRATIDAPSAELVYVPKGTRGDAAGADAADPSGVIGDESVIKAEQLWWRRSMPAAQEGTATAKRDKSLARRRCS